MPTIDYPDAYRVRDMQKNRAYTPNPLMTPAERAAIQADLAAYEVARVERELEQAKVLMSRLEQIPVDTISLLEARRTIRILGAHGVHPDNVLAVYDELDRPFVHGQIKSSYPDAMTRRECLSALLGIKVGYNPTSALQVIDGARVRPPGEVVDFVARELATVAVGAGATYGCAVVAAKGASAAATKYAALKTGGVVAGKGAALMVGGGAVAAAAVVVGVGCVALTVATTKENIKDHWTVFEALWNKDRRILEAIKEGRDPHSNPCPMLERPLV